MSDASQRQSEKIRDSQGHTDQRIVRESGAVRGSQGQSGAVRGCQGLSAAVGTELAVSDGMDFSDSIQKLSEVVRSSRSEAVRS